MLEADEARRIAGEAQPGRERAEADTLSGNALKWAMKNAIGQTDTRIRMYATYGRRSLTVKFAPGEGDGRGSGNSFYNDLLANSNMIVADAMSDIIYGREQSLISPLQQARLLNEYNAQLVHFIRTLRRLGYDVKTGTEASDDAEGGNAHRDDSTIIVSW